MGDMAGRAWGGRKCGGCGRGGGLEGGGDCRKVKEGVKGSGDKGEEG